MVNHKLPMPHLEEQPLDDNNEPIGWFITPEQLQYLQQMREVLIYESAYNILNWQADNLAIVAAANGCQRGKIELIDALIKTARVITHQQ